MLLVGGAEGRGQIRVGEREAELGMLDNASLSLMVPFMISKKWSR